MSDSNLNPAIREIRYGKKELKSLTIYPLSIRDQFKVTDVVTEIVQELVENQSSLADLAFMSVVIQNLEVNLSKILTLIAEIDEEEAKEVMEKMTNTQLMDVVEIIWEVNFEPSLKKGKDLFERGKRLFSSKRSSQTSSNAIPSTDSKMSTESDTVKED